MDMTLLIMAAGMGSRYGGNKQIDRMGPNGEILLEYSIYDAVKAGFNKFVFVIKHDFEERFREIIGDKLEKVAKVEYVFQEFDTLPEFYTVPEGRTKPFGTVHAVLAAKDVINEPFAVINADDFYGSQSYPIVAARLKTLEKEKAGCMAGYLLKNTVSENGTVTRGVCAVDKDGRLESVTETYKIKPFPDGTIRDTEKDDAGVILDPNCLVSMNFFGFTPWFFEKAQAYFEDFLRGLAKDELKKEFVLPTLVDTLMRKEGMKVDVLPTDAVWFGVTYQEDKPFVQAQLKNMRDAGVYPNELF